VTGFRVKEMINMSIGFKHVAFAALAAMTTVGAAQAAKTDGRTTVETQRNGRTFVSAPGTRVAVQPQRTKVRVDAPYTTVRVNTAANTVRIRVPYFNGDISW
jgi:hypothetical protein